MARRAAWGAPALRLLPSVLDLLPCVPASSGSRGGTVRVSISQPWQPSRAGGGAADATCCRAKRGRRARMDAANGACARPSHGWLYRRGLQLAGSPGACTRGAGWLAQRHGTDPRELGRQCGAGKPWRPVRRGRRLTVGGFQPVVWAHLPPHWRPTARGHRRRTGVGRPVDRGSGTACTECNRVRVVFCRAAESSRC